jgi:hypothetical protein
VSPSLARILRGEPLLLDPAASRFWSAPCGEPFPANFLAEILRHQKDKDKDIVVRRHMENLSTRPKAGRSQNVLQSSSIPV